jgi:hypothetical protein
VALRANKPSKQHHESKTPSQSNILVGVSVALKETDLLMFQLFAKELNSMCKSLDSYTKADWLAANTHGKLGHDTPIYRIFRVDYLLADIKAGKNTLVNPCFETQGDDLENPLKNAKFGVDGSQHQLFRGLMAEYYSQSWSLSKVDWGTFGQGNDVVRVRVQAGKLFDRLMDEEDRFYSLFYHMGIISYDDAQAIRDQITNAAISDFLDSRGYELLRTVMKIRSDFQKEQEVRLVYIRSPRDGYTNPNKNPISGDQNQFCACQFDWTDVIEGFEFDPKNQGSSDELTEAIRDANKNPGEQDGAGQPATRPQSE